MADDQLVALARTIGEVKGAVKVMGDQQAEQTKLLESINGKVGGLQTVSGCSAQQAACAKGMRESIAKATGSRWDVRTKLAAVGLLLTALGALLAGTVYIGRQLQQLDAILETPAPAPQPTEPVGLASGAAEDPR